MAGPCRVPRRVSRPWCAACLSGIVDGDGGNDMHRVIDGRQRLTSSAVVTLLIASAGCVAAAPLLMPASYSIVKHSVSESAAQTVEGAWLARAGLLLLGFAVLVLAARGGHRWGLWGRVAHRGYGVAIIASAAFAHMPWETVRYDEFEDLLHSIASFAVGFAFVGGVITVSVRRGEAWSGARVFDVFVVAAGLIIPMVMFNVTGIAGLVQRLMFALAYVWYGIEAVRPAFAEEKSSLSASD